MRAGHEPPLESSPSCARTVATDFRAEGMMPSVTSLPPSTTIRPSTRILYSP